MSVTTVEGHPRFVVRAGSLFYSRFLASRGIRRQLWQSLRHAWIWLRSDPPCVMDVHGRALTLPLSHSLPAYLATHECYDRLPHRLAQYVRGRKGSLTCIDVGANVGDSVAAFYVDDTDRFLAIEPNPSFRRYLLTNWGGHPSVVALSVLCSSASGDGRFDVTEHSGTATIRPSTPGGSGAEMQAVTLDDVIARDERFARANILKIDTDGHDFEVIAGAQGLISTARPAVLFECGAFSDPLYVEHVTAALRSFEGRGYTGCLWYDNVGFLIGKYALGDVDSFKKLLFYQLTSPFHYFDILVLNDEALDEFHALEVEYFVGRLADPATMQAARAAS
jgi:FkbM family methyltransferase